MADAPEVGIDEPLANDNEGAESGSEEEDPSLAERAQCACIRLCLGVVLAIVGAGILVYPISQLEKKGADFGGSHTQASVFGLALLGCIACSLASFCCLSPIADSIDAITDMIPCLPECLEEMIDGMADVVVGAISCLIGAVCTLLVLGIAALVYFPVYGAACLAVAAVLACCVFVGCSQATRSPPSTLKVVSKDYYSGFSGIYEKDGDDEEALAWIKLDDGKRLTTNENGEYVFSPDYIKSEPHEGKFPSKVKWLAWDQEIGDWVAYDSFEIRKYVQA